MKKRKINRLVKLLCLLVLFPSIIFSQEVEKLYSIWDDTGQPDSIRFASLRQICLDHLVDDYPDSAFKLAQTMYEDAILIENKKYQADALHIQGYIFNLRGNYASSKDYFLRSLQLSKDAGCTKRMAFSYGNIGNIYKVLGNWTEALEYMELA